MNYVRRLIFAIIILVILYTAWYGAEMLIYGESQRSVVDLLIAVIISFNFSNSIEKGYEQGERKRKQAEKFANEFLEHVKKREETKDGKNGSREEG